MEIFGALQFCFRLLKFTARLTCKRMYLRVNMVSQFLDQRTMSGPEYKKNGHVKCLGTLQCHSGGYIHIHATGRPSFFEDIPLVEFMYLIF